MNIQASAYPLRIDKEIMEKFRRIAKENGRSVNKEIEAILKTIISEYESKNGVIQIKIELWFLLLLALNRRKSNY